MKPKLVKKTQGNLDEIQKIRTGPMIRNKQSREAVAKATELVRYPRQRENTGGIRGKEGQENEGDLWTRENQLKQITYTNIKIIKIKSVKSSSGD